MCVWGRGGGGGEGLLSVILKSGSELPDSSVSFRIIYMGGGGGEGTNKDLRN